MDQMSKFTKIETMDTGPSTTSIMSSGGQSAAAGGGDDDLVNLSTEQGLLDNCHQDNTMVVATHVINKRSIGRRSKHRATAIISARSAKTKLRLFAPLVAVVLLTLGLYSFAIDSALAANTTTGNN